jgi:hypothetical protein
MGLFFNHSRRWYDKNALSCIESMSQELVALATIPHCQVDGDSYYSCEATKGGKCDCGADEHNAEVERIARAIQGELKSIRK